MKFRGRSTVTYDLAIQAALKSGVVLFAVGLMFTSTQASANCKDGEAIPLSGIVTRLFANKAHGWTIMLGHLNSDFVACAPGDMGGQKAASGPWYPLAVSEKPASDCKVGSHVDATMMISDELFEPVAKVANWTCK